MKFIKLLIFTIVLILTWTIAVFHRGVITLPKTFVPNPQDAEVTWIPKSKFGINQIILSGSPYAIGKAEGEKTRDLLYNEEKELIAQLHGFISNSVVLKTLEVFAIRWFWGIDKYFEPWMLEEMYGVSQSTSHEFDYLIDRFTRQIAYHGLHEVGQLAVDQGSDAMGCTVVALPHKKSWIIGRNFDFEGGRIFDSEKIMKWVFPEKGHAFLSVIWAGMVGAVTGVNEKGVYISLNAAGSRDFSRYGTPSTLLITKALMEASTAEEAVNIIKNKQMFITDIFIISDPHTGKLFRVEKSPKATEVAELTVPTVITNHLVSSRWQRDSINEFRTHELTSLARAERGEVLIKILAAQPHLTDEGLRLGVLNILRDKGEDHGHPLHLGNRKAIDALIATHSILYDEPHQIFYVSRGPAISGAFIGFDLKSSFARRKPMIVGQLPPDPLVTPELFYELKTAMKDVSYAGDLIAHKKCAEAGTILSQVKQENFYSYYMALGDYENCVGNHDHARQAWKKALALSPAYPRHERALREKLK